MNPPVPLNLSTAIPVKTAALAAQPSHGDGFVAVLGEMAQKSVALAALPAAERMEPPVAATAGEPSVTPPDLAITVTTQAAVSVRQFLPGGKKLPPALPVPRLDLPEEADAGAPEDADNGGQDKAAKFGPTVQWAVVGSETTVPSPVEAKTATPIEKIIASPVEAAAGAPRETLVVTSLDLQVTQTVAAPVKATKVASVAEPIGTPEGTASGKPKVKGRIAPDIADAADSPAAANAPSMSVPFMPQFTQVPGPAGSVQQALHTSSQAALFGEPSTPNGQPAGASPTVLQPGSSAAKLLQAPEAAAAAIAAAPQTSFQRDNGSLIPEQPATPAELIAASRMSIAPQQDTVPGAVTMALRQFQSLGRLHLPDNKPVLEQPDPLTSPGLVQGETTAAPAVSPVRPFETQSAIRPHDFTALVDRLVAARESLQPNNISITLPHAEFGHVALRFHNDGTGLSISMASPDPDFARAASLALPQVQQPGPGEPLSQNPGQPGSHSERNSAPGDQSSQSRHYAPDRRDDRSTQRGLADAEQRTQNGQARQSGIFA